MVVFLRNVKECSVPLHSLGYHSNPLFLIGKYKRLFDWCTNFTLNRIKALFGITLGATHTVYRCLAIIHLISYILIEKHLKSCNM